MTSLCSLVFFVLFSGWESRIPTKNCTFLLCIRHKLMVVQSKESLQVADMS